ncbi:tetratricopeptide repeat protein [Massilia sp. PWRC2]|uniref:glycosyltransferase family 9 protein n=1 Tax=Massilia sp. PWRC2 TaxID=2804626 RepID=UPI003CEC0A41
MQQDDQHQAFVHACFDDGVRRMGAGDSDGARLAFGQALALQPALPEAHINLGLLLTTLDPAQAQQHYRAAIALAPERVDGYLHLGAWLAAARRFDEAEHSYRQALLLDPASAPALSNLGVLLASTDRASMAAACYRAAIAIAPAYQPAHFNLAYLLLRDGDFEAGWREFEGRPWYARFADYFAYPRWTGEPLAGASLMIAVEAGHGDMIQFCRYAALARQQGAARVGIVCHSGLQRLFASLEGIEVYGVDDAVPRDGWDYWTPPLSMPYHFGTRLDQLPATLPYLAAPAGAGAAGLALLAAAPSARLRVGLAWQGNPRFENDGERSLAALATLAPLASVAGVQFYSLQKGEGTLSLLPDTGGFASLTDLAPALGDFADTAAVIGALDLVIAVDTAVAHLAGALGKPCWVMLPAYQTDWRWLRGRDDSPWYPRVMRLFRQQQAGDWGAVVAALRAALVQQVAAAAPAA